MTALTDEEYKSLQERVAKGKKLLEGKWNSPNPQYREWQDLWYKLSDQSLEEAIRRHEFSDWDPEKIKIQQEETLAKAREKLIATGYMPRPKERRKKNDQHQSERLSLFATSTE